MSDQPSTPLPDEPDEPLPPDPEPTVAPAAGLPPYTPPATAPLQPPWRPGRRRLMRSGPLLPLATGLIGLMLGIVIGAPDWA